MRTSNTLEWSNSWIASAERNLERVYQNNYFDPAQVARTADLMTLLPMIILLVKMNLETHNVVQLNFRSVLMSTFPEIIQYLSEKVGNRTESWQLNRPRYPILSRMARDCLAVPGSSILSEQIFSQAGDRITKKRTRI